MRRALLAAAAVLGLALGLGTPAGAQRAGERITDYQVLIDVASDGRLTVTETIDYDFGDVERHGIIRDLVRREDFDGERLRRYDLDIVSATVDGMQLPYDVSAAGRYLSVRLGDPDRTVTGSHTYALTYTVGGALLPFADHDELYWDALGHQWSVPIARAAITVTTPRAPTAVTCYAGALYSSLPCENSTTDGATSHFTARDLFPHEGVTVVVGIPKGAIDPPPQLLFVDEHTLSEAFTLDSKRGALAAAVGTVSIGGVLLLARRGRDRRFSGSHVDVALGNVSGYDERVPLFGRDDPPVEFVPPDGVRPGQVGTLVDERANLVDVTATIVDLAVRGALRISEVEGVKHDYELERLESTDELTEYEAKLRNALFAGGPTVRLSDLKYEFQPQLATVRAALYEDAVQRGWYRMRPDITRLAWRVLGVALLVLGIAVTVVVALVSSFGIVALPLVLAGVVMLFAGGRMPARTAKGYALLSRIRGFRRLFDESDEDLRARFAEEHGIFSQYLPYAIVFGCTEKWARAFEGLDAERLGTQSWYSGSDAFTFSAVGFAAAIDDFGTTTTGTLYASQPSSSSSSGFGGGGFSGGGGGGGGGSSW